MEEEVSVLSVQENLSRTYNLVGTGEEDNSRRGAEAQRMTENEIGTRVIEAAIAVHRELGPGLLETVRSHLGTRTR